MSEANVRVDDQHRLPRARSTWRDAILARGLRKAFGPGTHGRMEIILPSGLHVVLGTDAAPPARVVLHS